MKMGPYLHFEGQAEEAMNFYKDIFHADVVTLQRYADVPQYASDESMKHQIMHAFIKWGEIEMMFADAPVGTHTVGDNNYISLGCTSEEEIEAVYSELSAGAKKINIPLSDMFWGAKFAGFVDKFGIGWYLNWDKPKA